MRRTMLMSKLHRVRVTHCELDYEGSCAIDEDLMEVADIREYQKIDVYNVSNGERFSTYAIRGARGSRMISLNGAAARKAAVGDILIVAAYAQLEEREVKDHVPRLVYVDEGNRVIAQRTRIPVQEQA